MTDLAELREREFPVTREGIYFDHATFGPPPASAVAATSRFLQRTSEHGLPDLFELSQAGLEGVRAKAARLLGAGAENVFFSRSTSHGVGLVAEGLQWRPGDEVVVYELDHPACVLPWLNLARDGVRVNVIRDRGRFGFDAGDVRAALTPRTRVVALSLVNFAHGARAPLEAVGALCRERELWFVVDAVQGLGALRVDAPALGADVVSAHAYKFLLSGFGLGLCYCSERALRELRVRQLGWKSVVDPFDVERILEFRLDPAPGARRFEPSFPPLAQVFGLEATLDLLLAVGPDEVERAALAVTRRLAAGLRERGFRVVGQQAGEQRSTVLSVDLGDPDQARRVVEARRQSRVACALREGRLRLSPHFYNTSAEAERFLEALGP